MKSESSESNFALQKVKILKQAREIVQKDGMVRPFQTDEPAKSPTPKMHKFFIKTPFSMILACFEDNHKPYKIMHIHIIVYHVRRKI